MNVTDQHATLWPVLDSAVEPDARQAVIWALLGLVVPVLPSVMALYVTRRAVGRLEGVSGRTGLAHCRVAEVLGVIGLIWGTAALVAVLITA